PLAAGVTPHPTKDENGMVLGAPPLLRPQPLHSPAPLQGLAPPRDVSVGGAPFVPPPRDAAAAIAEKGAREMALALALAFPAGAPPPLSGPPKAPAPAAPVPGGVPYASVPAGPTVPFVPPQPQPHAAGVPPNPAKDAGSMDARAMPPASWEGPRGAVQDPPAAAAAAVAWPGGPGKSPPGAAGGPGTAMAAAPGAFRCACGLDLAACGACGRGWAQVQAATKAEEEEDVVANLVSGLRNVADTIDHVGMSPAAAVEEVLKLHVSFERPGADPMDVARRIQAFHGAAGPQVPVQVLVEAENRAWKKPPGTTSWWAEKGGDARTNVHRFRVPARPSYGRPSAVSIQHNTASRTVVAVGVKQNFLDFLVQWVGAFGPVAGVTAGQQNVAPTSVMQYLQAAAAPGAAW
ncbi:unnamed protein product, partial [Prorocentrum cordatum]